MCSSDLGRIRYFFGIGNAVFERIEEYENNNSWPAFSDRVRATDTEFEEQGDEHAEAERSVRTEEAAQNGS